jgi:hypothetical protein
VTLNGAQPSFVTINPVRPTLGGTHAWDIVLSMGWTTILTSDPSDAEEVGEPENKFELQNLIYAPDNTTIHFESEVPNSLSADPFVRRLSGVLIGHPPSGQRFDLLLADVPEPSSTVSIFGIGLVGLACFARIRRRAT